MFTRIVLFFLFSFLKSLMLFGQQDNFISYSVQEGLPQSQVTTILNDSKGYLWFGTQGGGVSRFDGDRFVTYTTKNNLSSNYVKTVFEDDKSRIWIGTQKGLSSYTQQKISYTKKLEVDVNCIVQDSDSTLLLGTSRGVYRFQLLDSTILKVPLHSVLDHSRVRDVLIDEQGFWIASSSGLFRKKSNQTKSVYRPKYFPFRDVFQLSKDKKGNVWVADFKEGIALLEAMSNEVLYRYNGRNTKRAQCIFDDQSGNVWVGTQHRGVSILDRSDSTWHIANEKVGLSHNNVQDISIDKWSNVWIATSGGGVNKYLGQNFTHFNQLNGLSGNRIYAVEQDSSKNIWLSVSNEGVTKIDSTGIYNRVDSGYVTSKCTDIFEDKWGRMWFCTAGTGVVMMDTTGYTGFNQKNGLPSNWIKSIAQDKNGNIWLASYSEGLFRIKEIKGSRIFCSVYNQKNGLEDQYISSLKQNKEGQLWFTTKKGTIGYIDGKRIVNYGKKEGVPRTNIRSIAFSQGYIWIGTAGEGVYRSSDNILNFSKIEKSLTSDNIYLLSFDEVGNLWVGSETGLDKFLVEGADISDVQHFGKNEGFVGIETCHNASLLDGQGNMWFGTLNGVTKHKPSKSVLSKSVPLLHFESIRLFNERLEETPYQKHLLPSGKVDSTILFKHFENNIGFDFKAIDLDDPGEYLYSWKLEGLDEDWLSPSSTRSINYTNLHPGKYNLLIKAQGRNLESEVLSTSFTIKKAIWHYRLFWVGLGVLALVGFYFLYRFQISRLRRKETEKREQLRIENELLVLEQKALQLQMNPHFIFNALNSIHSVVASENTQEARRQIHNFAKLMRSILSNSRVTTISLAQEVKTLEQYIQMEQFCQSSPFSYTIKVDKSNDPEEVEIPPMLIQPFVENAILHGFTGLDRDGVLEIEFTVKETNLHCIIKDNGVGRQKAAESKSKKKAGHQSTALKVTEERLQALLTDEHKAIQIDDVLDAEDKVKGTVVNLVLPFELNY